MTIYFNRKMVDFDREVKVVHNNKLVVSKKPKRDISVIKSTIAQRGDIEYIFEDYIVSIPENDMSKF